MKLERIYDKVALALQDATLFNNDFIVLPRSFIEDYQKLLNAQVNVNFNSQRTVKTKSLNNEYLADNHVCNKKYLMLL